MRVSRGSRRLWGLSSASLAPCPWDLVSIQAQQASASAGPPLPAQTENCIQLYLRTGLKTPSTSFPQVSDAKLRCNHGCAPAINRRRRS
jgi:hypothetical protein